MMDNNQMSMETSSREHSVKQESILCNFLQLLRPLVDVKVKATYVYLSGIILLPDIVFGEAFSQTMMIYLLLNYTSPSSYFMPKEDWDQFTKLISIRYCPLERDK